jgi:hypothetical protein
MSTAVSRIDETPAALLEKVVIGGDLSKLEPAERLQYYASVCKSVGLNPLTQPFEYINLNGKLRLYAKRDATDQLRSNKGISIQIVGRELIGEIYVVTARAVMPGREDEATGAVNVQGKRGDDLANAYMKAETKAKRRVTLSIAGLGLLDESELDSIDPEAPAPTNDRPVVSMPKPLAEKATTEHEVNPATKINEGQVTFLQKKLGAGKVTAEAFCQHFGIAAIPDLPFGKVNDALKWITENDKSE